MPVSLVSRVSYLRPSFLRPSYLRREASRLACGILMAIAAVVCAQEATANKMAPDDHRHVVSDARSGLALYGYDPVAFHIEGRAIIGKSGICTLNDGLKWCFASASNRAAFLADPLVYMPRFGGHDGLRISEGVMVSGDPENFVIAGGTLVLFRSAENRDLYAADEGTRMESRRRWPDVVRQNALH